MANEVESPQKAPRRSKRNAKVTGTDSTSSRTPSKSQHNTGGDHINEPVAQPALAESTQDRGVLPSAREAKKPEDPFPSTPPRSRSTQPTPSKKNHVTNESMQIANKGGASHKTQDGKQKVAPKTSQDATPSAAARQNAKTPKRENETPSKAYAGPTFHASPAASSLPMPKFFSKSVPSVDKASSLKNMMESEVPDSASETEEGPFIDHTKLDLGRQAREGSPLDIFFQADRKAKASVRSSGTPNALEVPSPFDSLRPQPSPSHGSSRHHSRHPTDSSIGGVFDLEMGGPASDRADRGSSQAQAPVYDRSISAPPGQLAEEKAREEKRQASTLALKNMLLSPQSRRPETMTTGIGSAKAASGSPSAQPHLQQTIPAQSQHRPSSSPGLVSDESRGQRQATLRALAERQIPFGEGYTAQGPIPSSLRKELTMPTSLKPPEPSKAPFTPTPTRRHGSPVSANTRSQVRNRNSASDHVQHPAPEVSKLTLNLKQQREVNDGGSSPTTAAMENDLRRILKIDA